MPEVTIGDLRIAYERVGEGPPLVLLHGLFGFDSRSWHPQLEGLSDAFTVAAWDMPGTGRSSDPPDGFRLALHGVGCVGGFFRAD
jgi:pimeloyl-ACP methyl ester carboxylesterase